VRGSCRGRPGGVGAFTPGRECLRWRVCVKGTAKKSPSEPLGPCTLRRDFFASEGP